MHESMSAQRYWIIPPNEDFDKEMLHEKSA
jgi:hypothetical protein